jgi:hypothetical protein
MRRQAEGLSASCVKGFVAQLVIAISFICVEYEFTDCYLDGALNSSWLLAKKAYALASIEQLVPVLSEDCLRNHAFPLCLPYVISSWP